MLHRMTWQQLVEWRAYWSVEPFGEQRADTRSALIAMILANANRDPKRRSQPYTIKDFMLFSKDQQRGARYGEKAPVTSTEDWNSIKRMAKVLAGGRT